MPPRARASLNASVASALRFGQQDEAALGAGHFERAVEHHRQHFVEHTRRPHGAETGE